MARKSNIELLRIISMLAIILHHAIIHGVFRGTWNFPTEASREIFSNGTFIYQILFFGGKFGVQVFVMITGYFMISSKISIKTISKFWVPVFTWSIIFLILRLLGMPSEVTISLKEIVKSILPILSSNYWFAQAYLMLFLVIPILNSLYRKLSPKKFAYLILFLLLVSIIIPTFTTIYLVGNNAAPLFILLYYIGALIRNYEEIISKNIRTIKIILPLSFAVYILSVWCLDMLGLKLNLDIFLTKATILGSQNSLLVLLCSSSVFIMFTQLNLPTIKWINIVASSTFGVYLIHDNIFFRSVLWGKITPIDNSFLKINQFVALGYILIYVLLIFLSCFLLERFRGMIMKRVPVYLGDRIEQVLAKIQSYDYMNYFKLLNKP